MAKMHLFALLCFCGVINAAFIPGYKRSTPSGFWYFKLHTTPKTWYEANIICQSENAQLAVINSEEEAKIFADEVVKYPAASIAGNFRKDVPSWHMDVVSLGFHEKFGKGNYVTLNGTPLPETGYAQWSTDQPSVEEDNEQCGSMFRDGRLNDLPCDEPFMFICETTFPFTGGPAYENALKCETFEGGYKLGSSTGDRFFKLHLEPKSWDEASLVCQTEGARLAIVNSEEEANIFIGELMKHPEDTIPQNISLSQALLGFHDRFKHGKYVTLDGTPIASSGYNKWSPGQPENSAEEHCGSISVDGLLDNVPCSSEYAFFCEKPSINSTNLWNSGICSDISRKYLTDDEIISEIDCETYDMGYQRAKTLYGDKYFKLHLEPKTWDDALLVCQSEQATLAVVSSEEESRIFTNEIFKHPPRTIPGSFNKDVIMLGFHDRLRHGFHETVHGKPLLKTGFYKWSPGQPDNSGANEHCGSMFRNGLLNDVSCDVPYTFICEKTFNNAYVLTENQARSYYLSTLNYP